MTEVLILDTSVPSNFARAGRLELLEGVLAPWTVVTTREVMRELREGAKLHPELAGTLALPWLKEVRLTEPRELQVFAEYGRRLGNGQRNLGERTILAWAECHGAVAILDDRVGRQVAKEHDVRYHGTLWLLNEGIGRALLDWKEADRLIQAFRGTGAYLPAMDDGGFEAWARRHWPSE